MAEKQVIQSQPRSQIKGVDDRGSSSRETKDTEIHGGAGWQTTNANTDGNTDNAVLGRGLSALQKVSKLEVEQRLDFLEASVCLMRQVTGAMRGLVLKMTDEDQQDVVLLRRPGACSSRCCWACCNLQQMDIVLPSGSVIASMHEVWSCCLPHYRVTDGDGQLLWTVMGSVCHCRCCCCEISFQFITPDGDVSATVSRSWQGCKELIGAANSFSIQFSDGVTVQQKLIILSGTFLADLNYFEKQNKCW
ncbi:hypothetical protein BaRGS_00020014 [Batillaria attramentaria]|uniref:Phospholipid scramblase n=1 Tax=Batillaria attramentaria TaxID=370345 RepID=A0ABD0KNF0_9CAEN